MGLKQTRRALAQGAAARHIGTVGKGLHRHPGLFADGEHDVAHGVHLKQVVDPLHDAR